MVASLLWMGPAQAAEPMAGYLMGYHTESPKGVGNSWSLHLAISENGLDWMPLNQNEPVLLSGLGNKGLMDPFFLRKSDGGFVVLATDQNGRQAAARPDIFVCDTVDFIKFDSPRLLKLHDTAMHTLAPEAFFNPDRNGYGILWSGDTDRHRIYVSYTSDFATVGSSQVFFDPGLDVTDATLIEVPDHGGHFLYYRDAAANRLRGTRSRTLEAGGFDQSPHANPAGPNITAGPLVMKALQENRGFLYGESNSPPNGALRAWQTDDISKDHWKDINPRDYHPPVNAKPSTVIPVTRVEMDRLVERWGRPKWNRLKSWNHPECLVRHESLLGKISSYPLDPYQDSQWKLVPGLADSGGVSFESVNFPGYYLRSVAEHVMLFKDDGSPAFKTKATFVKTPGLADRSWSSFRSFSSPGLYLRHAGFFLRMETVSSEIDRQDATFRIVY